jgi:tRNA A-37 threonylcarbamoyl transferase component Bud32
VPRAARIGTEFAGYRIEALVARGGTSTVYRAENARLGIPVALKVLNPELADDEAFRERFVRESRLAAAINHPNIITVYDAGVWDESLFIAMRYVAGGDLRRRIREGPLDPERALAIVAQAAGGLDAAHARGLVHRDVKPGNVMVDAGEAEDAPEIAYVSDFGLVKPSHAAGAPTPTGEFMGTIDYVAPEQAEGKPVDGRADVYALACVLYECLAGTPPFRRDNDAATLWAHMQEEPPRLSSARADVPERADEVVRRALAKRPDERFPTCGALVAAMRDALLDGVATTTGPLTVRLPRAAPAMGGSRRRWWRAAAAGLAGLALGAAGASAALLTLDEDGPAERAATTITSATTVERTVTAAAPSRLLAFIPESFRGRCRSSPPSTPDFDDSLVCRPGEGVQAVRYSHALSGPLLGAYLTRRVVALGFDAPTPEQPRVPFGGSCRFRQFPASEEWNEVGRAGHDPIGRTDEPGAPGRVLCHVSNGVAHIEWTTVDLGIYAHAYGRDYGAVFRWWQNEAGPLH